MPGPNGLAGLHVSGRLRRDVLPAARALCAKEIDPRRDWPDRRQVDVVVGVRENLIRGRHLCSAGAAFGADIECLVGVRAEFARHARSALASPLAGFRFGGIGLLPARRRQRRIGRRLRWLAELRLEFRDAGCERLVLSDELLDLAEQLHDQRPQLILAQRIECLRWHPELESVRDSVLNGRNASQTDAQG